MIPLTILFTVLFVVSGQEEHSRPKYIDSACLLSPRQTLITAPDGSYGCEIDISEWGTYYDAKSELCVTHTIKEPHATIDCPAPSANNFADEAECLFHCRDGCSQPLDVGHCENSVQRFYFDSSSNQCKVFNYTGCGGNRNNFGSLQDCESRCHAQPSSITESVEADPPDDCQQYSCKWREWIHHLVLGCVPIREHGACCPTYFDCNATHSIGYATNNETGCTYDEKHYDNGETIHMSDACQDCQCSAQFHGPGSSTCEPPSECDQDQMREQLSKGCVPVYVKDQCCPRSWQCPIAETPYRQQGPRVFHKEPEEMQCTYAGMMYPRPYELMISHGTCRQCTCLAPPYFTCREIVCPLPPSVPPTKRCVEKWPLGGSCCPEYYCWDIMEESNHLGLPITDAEKQVCDREQPCTSGYTRCQLNYTACYLGECTKTCEICAVPMCRFGSSVTPPYGCMTCGPSPSTPEEACRMNTWCTGDGTCVVDETQCRKGYCEPMCLMMTDYFRTVTHPGRSVGMPITCSVVDCGLNCYLTYDESWCPVECICIDTPEKACQYFTCSRGAQCVGHCEDGKCSPRCP